MASIHRLISCFVLFALISAIGCGPSGGSSSSSGGGSSMDDLAKSSDSQKAAQAQQERAAAAKAAEEKKAADAQAAQDAQQMEKRAVGSRPAIQGGGYLSAIAGAHRHVVNVVDNLAWIQGVRSFKAEEGRKPKNNDEFMKVVVTKYELQLPRIEEDEEYLYDPNGETDGDFGQLYVVKKQAAAAPPAAPAPPQPPQPPAAK